MASASVPDPSVPKPAKIRSGATKRERRAVAIGVAVSLALFAVFTLEVNSLKTLSVEQVNIAMPMIVQLDSFLTGGWVIAFFYFWGELEKALRASKQARFGLKSIQLTKEFDTSQRAILHQSMRLREEELTPSLGLFAELVFGVVMFIISAISAVIAVLTYTLISVQLALEFMVGGVAVMIITWISLRYVTQRLRELADVAIAKVED
jgi:hypothetical protein